MKMKSRLRRFWRHNKRIGGFWAFSVAVVFTVTPPYCLLGNLLMGGIALVWALVWLRERQVYTLNRLLALSLHSCRKDADARVQLHEQLIAEREERIKAEREKRELMEVLYNQKNDFSET